MKYTKQHILEAISYWESQLDKLNEDTIYGGLHTDDISKLVIGFKNELRSGTNAYNVSEPAAIDLKNIATSIEKFYRVLGLKDKQNLLQRQYKDNNKENLKEIMDKLRQLLSTCTYYFSEINKN